MGCAIALEFDLPRDDVGDLVLFRTRFRLRLKALFDDRMQYLNAV